MTNNQIVRSRICGKHRKTSLKVLSCGNDTCLRMSALEADLEKRIRMQVAYWEVIAGSRVSWEGGKFRQEGKEASNKGCATEQRTGAGNQAQSLWGTLGNSVEHFELSNLRSKKAVGLICELSPFIERQLPLGILTSQLFLLSLSKGMLLQPKRAPRRELHCLWLV